MYFIGDEKENNKMHPKTITQTVRNTNTEKQESVEFGLVEEWKKENIAEK